MARASSSSAVSCAICFEYFADQNSLNRHVAHVHFPAQSQQQRAPTAMQATQPTSTQQTQGFTCNVGPCRMTFRSQQGMNQHKIDAHGIGGIPIDLTQRGMVRQGLLPQNQPSNAPAHSRGRGGGKGKGRADPGAAVRGRGGYGQGGGGGGGGGAGSSMSQQAPQLTQQDVENARQATEVSALNVDLGLAVPPTLTPSSYTVDFHENHWWRISVQKQADFLAKLEQKCYLPERFQRTQFMPAAFEADGAQDLAEIENILDFANSPAPSSGSSKLKAIALACHRILMESGLEEVIVLSVVDILTCRVILSHVVLPDEACGNVRDWRTSITALSSRDEIMAIVSEGFAVLNGWKAARDALWAFIDRETIIVGHNVRADMDSLRMIHGRGVDVALMLKQLANGPLNKQQLKLENLCRDLLADKPQLHALAGDGHDCLEKAFAIRQIALETIDKDAEVTAWARNKSLELQRAGL